MLPNFKFHHIGIAAFSIENTAQYYIEAGYSKTKTVIDSIQNVQICFLSKENMPLIELLAPVDEKSPVNKTIEKVGVAPYHICYEVNDIENAVAELKKKKFLPIIKVVNACAMDNKRICFLYNKNVGLIELVES